MKHSLRYLLFTFLLIILSALFVWMNRNTLLERGLEAYANGTQKILFEDSLDFAGVALDRRLNLTIQKITGVYQAPEGPFPFEVHQIKSEGSLAKALVGKPVLIQFERLRPQGSELLGAMGQIQVENLLSPVVQITGDFSEIDFRELTVLNPENLAGASGQLTGRFLIKTDFKGEDVFRMNFEVREPGGTLQARFFDALKPYLPPAQARLFQAIEDVGLVGYREAKFSVDLAADEPALKIFLHILVPDYNLNLNLNVKVLVEEKSAFTQLAQLMGLIKIEVA